MGQYYYAVNLDKKQILHPHKLGDGLKFGEFTQGGTMFALAFLLADNEYKEGAGAWAGDRVVLAGDYGPNQETHDDKTYTDISLKVREEVIAAYPWADRSFGKRWDTRG